MAFRMRLAFILLLQISDVACLIRVCYFTNWSQHRPGPGRFLPENIDPFLCSHIVYAYAWLSGNQLIPTQSNDKTNIDEPGQYLKVTQLKELNPELRVLLAVGGWNAGSLPFSTMVSSQESRTEFINSTIRYLRDMDFDGIDLDWEYPGIRRGRSTDKENLNKLLKEMRGAFEEESINTGNEMLLITAVVPPGKFFTQTGYDVPVVTSILDFIHVMTYDFHGSWETRVGHPSPLYARTDDTGDEALLNMESSIKYWLSLGTPKEKLVASIAFYGRSFTLLNPDDYQIGAPDNGSGPAAPYTREPGFISYYEICDLINRGAVRYWHEEHKVPYLVNGSTWIGYDDAESISLKMRWLKDMDLGGVMIWALDLDDFKGEFCGQSVSPLLTTVNLKLVDRKFNIENTPIGVPTKVLNRTVKAFMDEMLKNQSNLSPAPSNSALFANRVIPSSVLQIADLVRDMQAAIRKKELQLDYQATGNNENSPSIPQANYQFPFNDISAKNNASLISYLQKIFKGNTYLNSTHISNDHFVQFLAQYVSGIKMSSKSTVNSTEIVKTSPKRAKLRLVQKVESGVFSPVLSQANTLGRLDMRPEISFSLGNTLGIRSIPGVATTFDSSNQLTRKEQSNVAPISQTGNTLQETSPPFKNTFDTLKIPPYDTKIHIQDAFLIGNQGLQTSSGNNQDRVSTDVADGNQQNHVVEPSTNTRIEGAVTQSNSTDSYDMYQRGVAYNDSNELNSSYSERTSTGRKNMQSLPTSVKNLSVHQGQTDLIRNRTNSTDLSQDVIPYQLGDNLTNTETLGQDPKVLSNNTDTINNATSTQIQLNTTQDTNVTANNSQTSSFPSKHTDILDLNLLSKDTNLKNNVANIGKFTQVNTGINDFKPTSIFNGMALKSTSVIDSSKIVKVSPRKAKLQLLEKVNSGIFTPLLSGKLSPVLSARGMDVSNRLSVDTNVNTRNVQNNQLVIEPISNQGVATVHNQLGQNQDQIVQKALNMFKERHPDEANMLHDHDLNLDGLKASEVLALAATKTAIDEDLPWYITLLQYHMGLKLKSKTVIDYDTVIKTSPNRAKLRHVEAVRAAVFSPTIVQMNAHDELQPRPYDLNELGIKL